MEALLEKFGGEMTTVWQDIRYGVRALLRTPSMTLVAVMTLALGIGANIAIFSVIEAVLLRPLPYAEPERIVLLGEPQNPDGAAFLFRDLDTWRAANRAFDDITFFFGMGGRTRVTVAGTGEPESLRAAFVDERFFPVFGVAPVIGRTFSAGDVSERQHVVVISYSQWLRRFGASPQAIGKTVRIEGGDWQVIGVMPPTFQFPERPAQMWLPITTNRYWNDPRTEPFDPNHGRGFYARWRGVARLRANVSMAQAQAELDMLYARLQQAGFDPNRVSVRISKLGTEVTANTRLALMMLWAAVGAVLLVACTNVSNLVLARGLMRQRELAVRAALGASVGRLVRQLLTESVLLATVATAVALLLAVWGVHLLKWLAPATIPRLDEAGLDLYLLLFALGLALAVALLFGLMPAWHIARRNSDASRALNTRGNTTTPTLRRLRSGLVLAEFALAVTLANSALLLVRSFAAVQAVDPGFRTDRVLTMRINTPSVPSPERLLSLHESMLQSAASVTGVEAAGTIDDLIESGTPTVNGLRMIEGREPERREDWTPLKWNTVSGAYFQAIGLPLLRGRFFNDQDTAASPWVALVDDAVVHRYWPNDDPIGRRFKGQDRRGVNDDWITVVGVVGTARRSGLEKPPVPHIYLWHQQAGVSNRVDLVVRTRIQPQLVANSLRKSVRSVDESAILSDVSTLEEILSGQLAPRRFQTLLLVMFSLLTLLLAGIGIYSVMHQSVAQRTSEIGIRMALGARPTAVLHGIVKEALRLAGYGVLLGVAGALVLARLLRDLLFGIAPSDPISFVTAVGLLLVIAAVGCYVPARRAARVDPLVALRHE
jgi:predicted permease